MCAISTRRCPDRRSAWARAPATAAVPAPTFAGARIHAVTAPPPPAAPQPKNPLHGLTLETIVTALVAEYGWAGLGERIPVRCFTDAPSVPSSLRFLRKTPWAREKVEGLYLFMLRERKRLAR